MSRMVVLDGYTANPGDLDWRALEALGELTVYDRTPLDQVVARALPAEIVLTNKTPLPCETLAQLSKLRLIGVMATGYNVVDVAAARARGVSVANVQGYSTASVVQHTFALLLELTNHVRQHAEAVRSGAWASSADFSFWNTSLVELQGLTFGVVGYGTIGRGVAAVAQSFGMRVVVAGRSQPARLPPGVAWLPVADLLAAADVVSLHCPLTPETRNLISAAALTRMKPTAFLINTGRGLLVDEQALATALNEGRLAGAAVDVLSQEPPLADNPLLAAKNCVITPHLAWATLAARRRLIAECAANVQAFLAGQPRNLVN